ncbi:MAG: hypothetical protein ACTSRK_15475 [Promethearchaeota archaeon]
MSEKCTLSNALIEGYLYEILSEWKDMETIFTLILERFGESVCVSSDLTKSGKKRYISKVNKVLQRGAMNNIYKFDEAKQSYKNNE